MNICFIRYQHHLFCVILGVEPVDHDVMKEPPRPKDAPILTRQILGCILTSAPVMVLGTLYVYRKEMAEDNMVTPRVTTMVCFDRY